MIFYFAFIFVACLAEPNPPNWPKNVYVFDPASSGSTQQIVNNAFNQNGGHNPPFNGQWSNNRYAFLFKPGTHNVNVNIGFYTSVIGLGVAPTDTTINSVQVENGDFDYTGGALDNFWRSAENFQTGNTLWAVSQACPIRRLRINGDLTLWQYNYGCCAGEASGGYLADTVVTGFVSSGSQQQYFTRNTQFSNWEGGVWNMVFVGNSHQLNDHCGDSGGNPWTSVSSAPSIAEKPYITIDNGGKFSLRVPKPETNKVGPTTNFGAATQVDFSQVYVATEADSAATINAKLGQGLHILLTPGQYQFSEAVTVKNPNTVILGIGFPTITATNGNAIFHIADVDGVRLGGVLLQAGRTLSQTLIQWGDTRRFGNVANPGFMYDVFVRVGGTNDPRQYQVSTNVMVTINHDYVVLDNSWLWRADHDITGPVVRSQNPSLNGLVVNGDNVVTYGLAVEHQLQDAVVWNGERGRSYFFQCEFPYDVSQQQFGTPGYAGFKVTAITHNGWGHGVYSFFRDYTVYAQQGIKASGGAQFVHPFTRFLSGNGGIARVLNNQGAPVNTTHPISYIC